MHDADASAPRAPPPRRKEEVMQTVSTALALILALAAPATVGAQMPVTHTETTQVTATIDAIDHDFRLVTLKPKNGEPVTVHAGPDIKRFDELKVGDTVTFRYQESIVYKVTKPGAPGTAAVPEGPVIAHGKGKRPGGTITQTQKATVTIKAIDPKVPAVTVQTADGGTSTYRVEDKGAIKDLKAGDKVEITYTEAVLIDVK